MWWKPERLTVGLLRGPRAERARGATQHRLGNLLQLSTDRAAVLPTISIPLGSNPEIALTIADMAVENDITPIFTKPKR